LDDIGSQKLSSQDMQHSAVTVSYSLISTHPGQCWSIGLACHRSLCDCLNAFTSLAVTTI